MGEMSLLRKLYLTEVSAVIWKDLLLLLGQDFFVLIIHQANLSRSQTCILENVGSWHFQEIVQARRSQQQEDIFSIQARGWRPGRAPTRTPWVFCCMLTFSHWNFPEMLLGGRKEKKHLTYSPLRNSSGNFRACLKSSLSVLCVEHQRRMHNILCHLWVRRVFAISRFLTILFTVYILEYATDSSSFHSHNLI